MFTIVNIKKSGDIMKIMPQEIEVWYVLPAIRAELSKQMLQLGISQSEIAEKLNVSRAAVTQYVKNKRANDIEFNEKIKKDIKAAAKRIVEDNADTMKEIHDICENIKQDKSLCKYHMQFCSVIDEDCNACYR